MPKGNEPGHVTAMVVAPHTQDRKSAEAEHEEQSEARPLPSAPPMDESLQDINTEAKPHPSENVELPDQAVSATDDGSDQRLLRNEDVTSGVQ